MNRCPRLIPAVLALAFGLALPAMAAVTLQPSEDAFTSTANPTGNFGGAGVTAVSSSSLPNGGFSGVMMFDFSSVKAALDTQYGAGAWTVQSVVMTMTVTTAANALFNTGTAAGSFNATWFGNGSWVEGTGNPNAPGSTGINNNSLVGFLSGTTETLGTFSYDGGTSGTRNISFTLSPGLVGDVTNGSVGSIAVTAADSNINMFFNSRSFGTTGARPFLTVTAIATAPEPARATLLAFAMVGLMLRRRRGCPDRG